MSITDFAWILAAFVSGSVPYSPWVGRLALNTDIRQYGDHNPGATNVLRAGGWQWGALALFGDSFKGAIPVGLAYFWANLSGWPLVAVALAPVLGHAFSPLLRFNGGKAVAVTFGIWAGLTLWQLPPLLGLALGLWFALVTVDGWAMLLALLTLGLPLMLLAAPWEFWLIWLGNLLILTWKHRADLRQSPGLRPWLRNRLRGLP